MKSKFLATLINLINVLVNLTITIFYVYPKCDSVFISIFYFLGFVYFIKLLIEQIFLSYGKSIK
jgi:hypothetical protein